MKHYLVTGGAGFIGTNLCEALRKKGHEVTAIDNLSVGDNNVKHLEKLKVKLVVANIEDYEAIEPHFKGIDVVIHLAAMNRALRSIEHPVAAHHANITGTLHVLEAMRKHKVPLIIFASSSSVYAGREGLLKENDLLAPPHPYGVGKLAGEHYVRVYSELFDLKQVTLRLFSVYGPRQLGTIDKAGVIAKFIHQSKTNQPITMYGEGNQQRNFTYVDDVVDTFIKASESSEAQGQIINVAQPEEITIKELAEEIIKQTKTTSKIIYEPLPKGDPPRNPADTTKAKNILHYQPEISHEEGIRKTIQWYDQE